MSVLQLVSNSVIPLIAGAALTWSALFASSYRLGHTARSELSRKLNKLRQKIGLRPESSSGEVLRRLQEVVSGSNLRLHHQSELLLELANERVPDEALRTCQRRWESLRSLLEVFPIFGILGTVCAMALASEASGAQAQDQLQAIMGNFGDAMYSTIWGLGMAALGMILLAFTAPRMDQWLQDAEDFKTVVHKADLLAHVEQDTTADLSGDKA